MNEYENDKLSWENALRTRLSNPEHHWITSLPKDDRLDQARLLALLRAYRDGYDDGYEVGAEHGRESGLDDGYSAGYQTGFDSGYESGHDADR